MPEAARSDDPHECHQVEGNRPHRGGPIEVAANGSVMTGHLPQARAGDRCRCDGAPDLIVTGSNSVFVDGKFAARKGDRTMHPPPGRVTGGCGSVFIGGRPTGATLGGGVASRSTCEKAIATREGRRKEQSFGNCGVESVRQIINYRRSPPLTEQELLDDALSHDEATPSTDRDHHGGATAEENVRTLARYGVAASAEEMDYQQIIHAVAAGRGVITTHEVAILWGARRRGSHAVLVAGIDFDDEGRLVAFKINDTGWGECVKPVDPQLFERSLQPGQLTVVTNHPLW